MIGGEYSLTSAWRQVAAGWHEFFHAPQDLRTCALVRIAYAAVLLVNLACLYPDLDLWFTDGGILPAEASREIGETYKWSLLWHLPATSEVVRICFWLLVGHTGLLLIGFLSRLNALAALVWLISFQSRNWMILDGEDMVLRVILLCLVLMPCGACWSVDATLRRWWQRRKDGGRLSGEVADLPHAGPAFGLRMLQIQMVVIFVAAGLWKLAGDPWVNGTAIYYVARLDDYFGRFPVPTWPFDSPWVVAIMTWSVILVEVAAPPLLWFRETRRTALLAILLFHLANEWTMNLFLFHWIMVVGWLSFVRPADWTWRRFPVSRAKLQVSG